MSDQLDPIMQFFQFDHLPPHLQVVSSFFYDAAHKIVATVPRNAERTVALRKLLESKDAAVRAAIAVPCEGRKDDATKARWDLIDWALAAHLVGQKIEKGESPTTPFEGAPRPDLVPSIAMVEVERVLAFGGLRYGEGNWREVPNARRRYFAAAIRHLIAWWLGEKVDKDTGLSHLAHCMCCLLFLLSFEREKVSVNSQSVPRG